MRAWLFAVIVAEESNGNKKYPLQVSFYNFLNTSVHDNLKFSKCDIIVMTQICGEMNEIDEAEQEHLYSAL